MKITPLPASGFRRRPWKNGLGETVTIAAEAEGEGWQDVLWSLSRTEIANAGPFSDFSGYERWQAVIEGTGLVLETPEGEISLRQSFRPVRYDGALPVRARLEDGKVGVVNLIARKGLFAASMIVLDAGRSATLPSGVHVLFAPTGEGALMLDGERFVLRAGDGLRIDSDTPLAMSNGGPPLVGASIGGRAHHGA